MLGTIILLYLIQAIQSWDKDGLCSALPLPVKSIQSHPIPLDFVFGKENMESTIWRNARVFSFPDKSKERLASDDDDIEVSFSDDAAIFLSDASNITDEDKDENTEPRDPCAEKEAEDEKIRILNLCGEAEKIVRTRKERSRATGSNDSHEQNITSELIDNVNQKKLTDIGDPN